MARQAKRYRLQLPPESLVGVPRVLSVRFADEYGTAGRDFLFGRFRARTPMAAELALAFRYYAADKTSGTRETTHGAVTKWFKFLDETGSRSTAIADIDEKVLRSYVAWLNSGTLSKATRHAAYGSIRRLLSWLLRNRRDLVSEELAFPFNPFPRPQSDCRAREILSRSEIEAVLAAARREIERNWQRFSFGQAALASADRAAIAKVRDLNQLDLRDPGVLLAVISDRFVGQVPTSTYLRAHSELRPLYRAISAFGGVEAVSGSLHATSEVLTPYLLAIGANLYANPSSLVGLERDCLLEHVLLDGRAVVSWNKERAGRTQRRSFIRGRGLSVPNLIDQVLALSAPLVSKVTPSLRRKLFLCVTRYSGARHIGLYPKEASSNLAVSWRATTCGGMTARRFSSSWRCCEQRDWLSRTRLSAVTSFVRNFSQIMLTRRRRPGTWTGPLNEQRMLRAWQGFRLSSSQAYVQAS